ncbi:MAG: peptidoglycan DD-metalloendopeptidase family protein [Anaerolineales bacterium]|nr:peptidoglycan DD-metalloendopeptidase family protein [Anaerolineales bacterium]
MKIKMPARIFLIVAILLSAIPQRVFASSAPPVDMFQLPWEQGKAWVSFDGLDNGTKRSSGSPHNYKNGGAIDFAPHVNMVIGEDTSNAWVTAAAAGTVTFVGSCYIFIDHGNGWTTEYWHLDNIQVATGSKVSRNQKLAIVHNNANAQVCPGNEYPGPHLHFVFRPNVLDTRFAGWTVNYNIFTNKTTYTKNGQTVPILTPLLNIPDMQTVTRGILDWNIEYTGSVDPYRRERWSLMLIDDAKFEINVSPEGAGLVPVIVLLNSDGVEVMRANGTLSTTQPAGFYYVEIQSEAGTGYYNLIATKEESGGATVTPSPTSTTAPETATPTPTGTPEITHTPTATLTPTPDYTATSISETQTAIEGTSIAETQTAIAGTPIAGTQTAFAGTQTAIAGTSIAETQTAFAGTQTAFAGTQTAIAGTSIAGTQTAFAGTQTAIAGTSIAETQTAFAGTQTSIALTQTAVPTPTGPYVLVDVIQPTLTFNETSLVNVSLNNVPPEGYTSTEFVCNYDPLILDASNILAAELFGTDPVSAANGPQNGQFILAIAGSNGKKATSSGTAFTFAVRGLQPGQSIVQCTARVSMGQGGLQSIAYIPDYVTVVDVNVTPTSTATSEPTSAFVAGQVIASKPVTIQLFDVNNALVVSQTANPDGTFNIPLMGGTYTIIASAEGFLNAQGFVTLVNGVTTTMQTVNLPAGDIDGNSVIDQFDALTIGINYNGSIPSAADLNNDSTINVLDLELLAANYRLSGALSWQ